MANSWVLTNLLEFWGKIERVFSGSTLSFFRNVQKKACVDVKLLFNLFLLPSDRLSGGCGRILGVCRGRLANGDPDGGHFPAVCRALVSEAVDLSTFMDKVATREAEIDEELNDLALQVMNAQWTPAAVGKLRWHPFDAWKEFIRLPSLKHTSRKTGKFRRRFRLDTWIGYKWHG